MAPSFGTDGLRGVANQDLTPELVLALGRAAARVLGPGPWVLGRDTRRSSPMLAGAFAAGLTSEGADVADVGMLPTPAVAYLAQRDGAPGAVVSASHNPFPDNGIKVFAAGGTKLDLWREAQIEAELERLAAPSQLPATAPARPVGSSVGQLRCAVAATGRYEEHLHRVLDGRRLEGLRVVLDCAHGAASEVAPRVMRGLGAQVRVLAASPDGTNINDRCGSTHPASLAEAVVASGSDLGLAYDGDADRLLAVAADATVVDGDHLMAIFARDLQARGALKGDGVAVTVMTNLGFRMAMAESAIAVHETPVGDRHVLEAIEREGLSFGGEQSGHLVFRELATTGDGILTGVLLCDLLLRSDTPLAELARLSMRRLPQCLRNVAVGDPARLQGADDFFERVRALEATLAGGGRVLVRPSGTEPVVRIMVEAESQEQAESVANHLQSLVEHALT